MNRKWAVSLRNPGETIVAEGSFVEVKGDFVEIGATLVRAEDVRIVAPVGTGEASEPQEESMGNPTPEPVRRTYTFSGNPSMPSFRSEREREDARRYIEGVAREIREQTRERVRSEEGDRIRRIAAQSTLRALLRADGDNAAVFNPEMRPWIEDAANVSPDSRSYAIRGVNIIPPEIGEGGSDGAD